MFLPRIARQHAEAPSRKPALSQERELRASLAGAGRQSQSGQPVGTVDNAFLETAGLYLTKLKLLPDCLLIDARDVGSLWFVEVVATDGPVPCLSDSDET